MSQNTDNPPAFPSWNGDYLTPGMTLWDYYTGQALAGLCGNSTLWKGMAECGRNGSDILKAACEMADSLMEERKKRFNQPPVRIDVTFDQYEEYMREKRCKQ